MIKKLLLLIMILIIILVLISCPKSEIEFGSYWQSYEIDGAKTPIEWIILDETETAYLLISKYTLDASIFNHIQFTTWENSYIRQFLNFYFYNNAFTEQEKQQIILTKVTPHTNLEYTRTKQGKTTYDYVFLLSCQEVEQYINKDNRYAFATPFSLIGHKRIIGEEWGGVMTTNQNITSWWLRTMGQNNKLACAVSGSGLIMYTGETVYAPHYGVRPCIWIKK